MKNFSLQRIKLLLIRYFRENWKKNVIIAAIVFGIEMLTSSNPVKSAPSFPFLIILLIIYTGRIFANLGNKQASVNYLMIPASSCEKVTTNFILSQLYYPIVLICASSLGILASTFTNAFFLDVSLQVKEINFFGNISPYILILSIVLLNSIMFFGSVYFKKKAPIKTLLCLLAIMFSIAILVSIAGKIGVAGSHLSIAQVSSFIDVEINWEAVMITIYSLLTLLFWFLTFNRLKETEA